jgi:hypothetical protein
MSGFVAGAVVVSSAISSRAASRAGSQQAASCRRKRQAFNLKRRLKLHEYKRMRRPEPLRYRHNQPAKRVLFKSVLLSNKSKKHERTFEQQRGFLQPYQEPGLNALARIQAGIAPGGEFARPFTMDQFQADPGYAFRLSEGQKALERQAAARGGLISGSALKAASRFGQEMGSQEFQNAFARAQTERANVLNPFLLFTVRALKQQVRCPAPQVVWAVPSAAF